MSLNLHSISLGFELRRIVYSRVFINTATALQVRTDGLSIFATVSRTRGRAQNARNDVYLPVERVVAKRAGDSSPVFSGAKATKTNPGPGRYGIVRRSIEIPILRRFSFCRSDAHFCIIRHTI